MPREPLQRLGQILCGRRLVDVTDVTRHLTADAEADAPHQPGPRRLALEPGRHAWFDRLSGSVPPTSRIQSDSLTRTFAYGLWCGSLL